MKSELYLGDAYALVEQLKNSKTKVDHIITDPPYNISQENRFTQMGRTGIDFGEWDKDFDLTGWINEYVQLLNKNGSIIIFCSYRNISYFVEAFDSAGIVIKDILVWKKSNPMPRNVNRRYVQDMEFAIWGVKKNSKWIFNKPDDVPYLRSLFETSTVSGKEKNGHPTQKSLKLMEHLIKVHTNEGETVIDPFMGSGTTGEAAVKLGRNFIGIEREPEFYAISYERVKGEKYEPETT